MHFREQGRVLQLIRTTYDPVKRRGVQTVVGNMPQYSYVIPGSLDELLTLEERSQLADYLNALKIGREDQSHIYHLRDASTRIAAVTAALQAGVKTDQAVAIWSAITDLSKALKKAGYPKPVLPKKALVVSK